MEKTEKQCMKSVCVKTHKAKEPTVIFLNQTAALIAKIAALKANENVCRPLTCDI